MKVCIVGAGAIGGFLGARLGAAGCVMSAVARGATLEALRARGFVLLQQGERIAAAVHAEDDPARLGPQDLVVLAVKGQALPAAAQAVTPLLAPRTLVLTAMNGVPWWFFDGLEGPYRGLRVEAVDPDGRVRAAIPVGHVIGAVVHASCSVAEPGVVQHAMGRGLIIGEPGGGPSTRVTALAGTLTQAGLDITVSSRIQSEVWYKLWGNMTMNPVSALTGATCDRILDDELVRGFCQSAMREAAAIGERIGCPIAQTPEERNAVTRKLGAFKTSMLQDAEAGKPLEIDPLLTAVHEIGRKVGVPTPSVDALLGLTRLYGRVHGLY